MRTTLVAAACLLLTAGCSASHPSGHANTTTTTAATQANSSTSSAPTSPTTSPSSRPDLTAPSPAANSPALRRYKRTDVEAALNLAAHLAYYGVADPKLLGTQSPHAAITDYADITRYLSPRGVQYLRSYITDQTTNAQHEAAASTLALANLTKLPGHGTALTAGQNGLRLDKPFHVADYTATINPRVTLNGDGSAMVVTGTCSARILGHRGATPVYVTFTRTRFTYNIVAAPSQTYPVGVEGWNSTNSVHVNPR